ALTLAERGLASTDPNPRVGCVIAQGERIVGEGWHERAGQAHAEVTALEAAGAQAAGATVYVTLEPCSHHGRTPPCVEALLRARAAPRFSPASAPCSPTIRGSMCVCLRRLPGKRARLRNRRASRCAWCSTATCALRRARGCSPGAARC